MSLSARNGGPLPVCSACPCRRECRSLRRPSASGPYIGSAQAGDPLGHIEYAVLDAVHRGALRSRRTARQIRSLRDQPAGEVILHEVLYRCEHAGLLSRARLRADRRFRLALVRVLLRAEG